MKPDTPYECAMHHLTKACSLLDGLPKYINENSGPIAPVAEDLIRETLSTDWEKLYKQGRTKYLLCNEMLAGAYEAKLLVFLAKLLNAKKILEIGMFTGLTTLCLADWTCESSGKVITCEHEPYLIEFAESFYRRAGVENHIEMLCGDALLSLDKLNEREEKFDMIFIDADKIGYKKYYEFILSKNIIEKDGIICVDNTLFKGMVYSEAMSDDSVAIADFNEAVKQDNRVEQVILPVRDGLSLIRIKRNENV